MKKVSKIILSICFAFVVSFSLVACDFSKDKDDDNNSGTNSEEILDRTSYSSFMKWLYNNSNISEEYEGTATLKTKTSVETFVIKSDVKNVLNGTVRCVAQYDNLGNLKKASMFTKGASSNSKMVFNVENSTYKNYNNVSELDLKEDYANLYCAYGIMLQPYQYEINQGLEFGVNYFGELAIETVTNPESGKYILTRDIDLYGTHYGTWEIIVINDRIVGVKYLLYQGSDEETELNVTYTYKDVTVNIDLTQYQEQN